MVEYRQVKYSCAMTTGFFWLHWVFVAARRLSLVAVSGGYSVAVRRFLIAVASRCGARALGSWAQ